MTCDFKPFFNNISVISGQWEVDNERLCVMELCLRLRRFCCERVFSGNSEIILLNIYCGSLLEPPIKAVLTRGNNVCFYGELIEIILNLLPKYYPFLELTCM